VHSKENNWPYLGRVGIIQRYYFGYQRKLGRIALKEEKPKKQPTINDDALSNEDRHILIEYKVTIEPLWEATMRLEGEALEGRNGALWEALPMFEYILDCFYELYFKYQDDDQSNGQLFHVSLQLGIQKADDLQENRRISCLSRRRYSPSAV
jgi:hypothetical protein